MPHLKIREYNTANTHPGETTIKYNNDLCQAIRAGNQVFLRGGCGGTLEGASVGTGDPAAQTAQAMQNIGQLLEEAGSKLAHIVKMTVYVTDWRYREEVYRVIGEVMKGIHYCSTGITVAGLARPEFVVEIDAHAVIPDEEL